MLDDLYGKIVGSSEPITCQQGHGVIEAKIDQRRGLVQVDYCERETMTSDVTLHAKLEIAAVDLTTGGVTRGFVRQYDSRGGALFAQFEGTNGYRIRVSAYKRWERTVYRIGRRDLFEYPAGDDGEIELIYVSGNLIDVNVDTHPGGRYHFLSTPKKTTITDSANFGVHRQTNIKYSWRGLLSHCLGRAVPIDGLDGSTGYCFAPIDPATVIQMLPEADGFVSLAVGIPDVVQGMVERFKFSVRPVLGDLPIIDISQTTPQQAIADKAHSFLDFAQKVWRA